MLGFVPLMAILFVPPSILEDAGYLARAAFVADRLIRLIGLPGRASLPLIVGFGRNVPALAGTRILADRRHRLHRRRRHAAAGSRAASPLRRIPEEITGAHEAVSLDEIARRIGVIRDEADAIVAYWVRKGRLSSDDMSAACPSSGCGTCPSGDNGKLGCGTRRDGPVLLAITRRPPS